LIALRTGKFSNVNMTDVNIALMIVTSVKRTQVYHTAPSVTLYVQLYTGLSMQWVAIIH
jgi:hypothetical protein